MLSKMLGIDVTLPLIKSNNKTVRFLEEFLYENHIISSGHVSEIAQVPCTNTIYDTKTGYFFASQIKIEDDLLSGTFYPDIENKENIYFDHSIIREFLNFEETEKTQMNFKDVDGHYFHFKKQQTTPFGNRWEIC